MIKKTPDAKWQVDVQPGGRAGKRVKRIFKTLAEAKRFENHLLGQSITQPWNPPPKDSRKLNDLIEAWWSSHGQHLESGPNTKSRLLHFSKQIGNPIARNVTAKLFSEWRSVCMNRVNQPMQAAGVNHVHSYLRAMFNHLIEVRDWHLENPLESLQQLRKSASEPRYLTDGEIATLLAVLEEGRNPHALLCSKLALSTGARWNEAEGLQRKNLTEATVRYHTRKDNTGGKWRTVPISIELFEELAGHMTAHSPDGIRLFSSCSAAFRHAIKRADIDLPPGQLTHVLRHTFATCFLKNGGDIRTLQSLLGHATIAMTMKYAHLVESQLQMAVRLNPLAILAKQKPPS
jgi:integrase